ncbi:MULTISPECIES: transposase, partial [unclassified Mesorhizobium]|uniref:transposase n=1 Tax=unclassified Mesorhizobium TaxID=325217 RepID=UPI001092E88A
GQRSPKAIAALVGLAPFDNKSGKLNRRSQIQGGRSRVRRALYMAALTAIRTCERFKTFYTALAAPLGVQETGHHRRRKEAPGRPQRYHSRQNRIRVNTVAMPLPLSVAAVQNDLYLAPPWFFARGNGMDPRVCASASLPLRPWMTK